MRLKQHPKFDRLFTANENGQPVRYVKSSNGKLCRIRSDTEIGTPSFLREYRSAFANGSKIDALFSATDDYLQATLRRARNRAYKKGMKFSVTLQYIRTMYERQGGVCAINGLEMSLEDSATRPSVDRIDCSKGYINSNIRLVCWAVNAGLNSFGTDKYIEICKAVVANNP